MAAFLLIALTIGLGVLNAVGVLALPLWLILLPLAPLALGAVVALFVLILGAIGAGGVSRVGRPW